MELPQEIEVWYIIPALRKELAVAMKEQGLKQSEIAKRMGLTKAAITNYITKKRAKEINFDKEFKLQIKESSKRIKDEFTAMHEIQKLLQSANKTKIICEIHRMNSNNKELSECNACFE